MSPPIRQFSFASGEISPSLYARTDLNRYENGLRTLRNMIVMRQGGVTGRPGTEYVSTALNGGNQVRLIPFIFNETGFGQSYALEFGNQYIAFYQNGGVVVDSLFSITSINTASPIELTAPGNTYSAGDIVTIEGVLGTTELNGGTFLVHAASGGGIVLYTLDGTPTTAGLSYISGGTVSRIYKIASPYLQADLQNLQYAQCADIVTIVHPNYAPKELARSGATNWALNAITFAPPVSGPTVVSLSGTSGANFYGYAVTSVNSNGEESDNLQLGYNAQRLTLASITNPITVSWTQVSGAVYYRIYFDNHPVLIGFGLRPTQLGFVGQSTNLSFIDSGFTPDYTNTPPLSTTSVTPNLPLDIFSPLFSTANNYPSTVGFVQQRRAFANTLNNPIGFWLSQPGDFYNFDTHVAPSDSDGIISSIAGEQVNAIQHIEELKFMLMLTAGAEIYVQGNGAGVVTPSQINASTQSQYGASPLKPLKVGDVLIFQQSLGSFMRDFTFDFAIDGYRGNDITIFSSHFFEGFQILDWAYQKIPDSIIWAVRSDGVLLSCTYVREQEVLAWARHDFTDGFIENVVSIPENGQYAVYLSIRRIVGGETVRYIERMSSRIWTDPVNTPPVQNDPINASYLDSFAKFDGRNNSSTTMQITPIIVITANVNDFLSWSDTAQPRSAIIPAGTYSLAALCVAIEAVMNAINPFQDWVCSVINGLLTFTNNGFYTLTWNLSSRAAATGATLGWPVAGSYSASSANPFTAIAPAPIGLVQDSTAYQQQLTLLASNAFFNANMVGDQIFIEDNAWIHSQGKDGNQIRCTIQAYTDTTHVTITPSGIIPAEFNNAALTTWAHAVASISGLIYLEGQEVSVWADRFVVGSPFNFQVSQVYTVLNGSITLDKQYSVIYAGLPMTQDAEPLDLESYFGETMLGKRKRVSRVSVYAYNTRSFFVGGQNPDTNEDNTNDDPLFQLYEEKNGRDQETYDVAPELMTKQDYVIVPTRWTHSGRVFFRNVDPVPFSLLAIAPSSEDPVQTPYKRGG